MFEFKINARSTKSKARTGEFKTPHGILKTPALAIVGTEGQIRSIPPDTALTLPLNYTIVNTFHIWTKGIIDKIEPTTVHKYGGFPGVVASDSGGFQVFSLGFGKTHKVGKLAKKETRLDPCATAKAAGGTRSASPQDDKQINYDRDNPLIISEEGVTFDWNSEKVSLNPELSMELQHKIGADIIFAFDECTSPMNSKEYVSESIERTDRWLTRCIKAHNTLSPTSRQQALFAIVQGSEWEDLRIKSAKLCAQKDVPGFGIGGSFGSSFGDSKKNMHQVLEWIVPHLPDEKPRHLLGIGQIDDLFECIERGVDLFDCVIPTREARHRVLYTMHGKKEIKKIKTLNEPIAIDCKCIACSQKVTGQQLYELFLQKDPRAFFYTTAHNIQFFADLMEDIREAIKNNRLESLKNHVFAQY